MSIDLHVHSINSDGTETVEAILESAIELQLEAISCALGAVYTTNKSFRSEHSSTYKHVSEFTHFLLLNQTYKKNDRLTLPKITTLVLNTYSLFFCTY